MESEIHILSEETNGASSEQWDIFTVLPGQDLRSFPSYEFEELVQLQRLGACPTNGRRL
jgi:hypothetical protein